MEEFEKLKRLIEQISDDVFKAVGGNKAAGTRVRKVMQEIKLTAQSVREKILTIRGSEDDDSGSASTAAAGDAQ